MFIYYIITIELSHSYFKHLLYQYTLRHSTIEYNTCFVVNARLRLQRSVQITVTMK